MSPLKHMTIADDVRVKEAKPLIPPAILLEDYPVTSNITKLVIQTREEITQCLSGNDDRLVCIVGPCSVHDPEAASEYAKFLVQEKKKYEKELVILMRVYFEKPRTTVGWKGLINDPDMDDSFKINKGLKVARKLLIDINRLGLPCATEFLETITPQFISDLVSWGAIGARTTESQCHRELASGVSCPVGFKNGTSGDHTLAIDACLAASHTHCFLGVTKQGLAGIISTEGNPGTHVILRGGKEGPNYEKKYIDEISAACTKRGVSPKLIVDCSHGNSRKVHKNQILVAENLSQQIVNGEKNIMGVMIESNLKEGNQKLVSGKSSDLEYGKSITDACINIDQTMYTLQTLASAVKKSRQQKN